MLQTINIRNFVLIESLEIDLSAGFNVITGETGAGKSILLDSILFCFGQKINKEIIRSGSESASVSISMLINKKLVDFLKQNELAEDLLEDLPSNSKEFAENVQEIVIRRTLNIQGRSKHYFNDQPVSKKLIESLFNQLIEMHGQHTHTDLLDPRLHIHILDEFAKIQPELEELNSTYRQIQKLSKEISIIQAKEEEILTEIDYLRHNIDELNKFNIQETEFEQLLAQKLKLASVEREERIIRDNIERIESCEFGQIITKASKDFAKSTNPEILSEVEFKLSTAYDNIEDALRQLQDQLYNLTDPDLNIELIEDRIHEARSLSRKHNCQAELLWQLLPKMQESLTTLEKQTSDYANMQNELADLKNKYLKQARNISATRIQAANNLIEKTHQELQQLEMLKTVFKVEISTDDKLLTPTGIDKVHFAASTNPGTPASDISKIASGGELSRFMLAFRAALLNENLSKTIIFDEIDVGISGSIAQSIGQRLQNISKKSQLIVITHQPQVAGKANSHILIEKQQLQDTTHISASIISSTKQQREIARMISGKTITDTGIKAAKELID